MEILDQITLWKYHRYYFAFRTEYAAYNLHLKWYGSKHAMDSGLHAEGSVGQFKERNACGR